MSFVPRKLGDGRNGMRKKYDVAPPSTHLTDRLLVVGHSACPIVSLGHYQDPLVEAMVERILPRRQALDGNTARAADSSVGAANDEERRG